MFLQMFKYCIFFFFNYNNASPQENNKKELVKMDGKMQKKQ